MFNKLKTTIESSSINKDHRKILTTKALRLVEYTTREHLGNNCDSNTKEYLKLKKFQKDNPVESPLSGLDMLEFFDGFTEYT